MHLDVMKNKCNKYNRRKKYINVNKIKSDNFCFKFLFSFF